MQASPAQIYIAFDRMLCKYTEVKRVCLDGDQHSLMGRSCITGRVKLRSLTYKSSGLRGRNSASKTLMHNGNCWH